MIENFQRSNYFIMLAAGAMLIGFAPIFVKWSELSSSGILFYRMFLTLPFLLALNLIKNKTFNIPDKIETTLKEAILIFSTSKVLSLLKNKYKNIMRVDSTKR